MATADSAWVFAAVSWCLPWPDSPLDPPYRKIGMPYSYYFKPQSLTN